MKLATPFSTLACAGLAALVPGLASPAPLQLTQIYGPAAVKPERLPSIQWIENGNAYTTLEASSAPGGGKDVVRNDTATGVRTLLVRAALLTPAGAPKPLDAGDHEWSPDGRVLLLKIDADGARRNNPIGDYWLFDTQTRSLRRVGLERPPGTSLYAQFSPDGSRIAYVSANNLYVERVEPVGGGAAQQLTSDGNDVLLNGRGDLV